MILHGPVMTGSHQGSFWCLSMGVCGTAMGFSLWIYSWTSKRLSLGLQVSWKPGQKEQRLVWLWSEKSGSYRLQFRWKLWWTRAGSQCGLSWGIKLGCMADNLFPMLPSPSKAGVGPGCLWQWAQQLTGCDPCWKLKVQQGIAWQHTPARRLCYQWQPSLDWTTEQDGCLDTTAKGETDRCWLIQGMQSALPYEKWWQWSRLWKMANSFPIQQGLDISCLMTSLLKHRFKFKMMTLSRMPVRAGGQQARKMQIRMKKKLQCPNWSEHGLRQELREKANSMPGTEFRGAFTPSLMRVALLSHVADQSTTGISSCWQSPLLCTLFAVDALGLKRQEEMCWACQLGFCTDMFKTNANDQCCGSWRKGCWDQFFFSSVSFHWILSEAVTMDDVSFFQTKFSLVVHWFLRWITCHVMKAVTKQWREGVRRKKPLISGTRIASGWVRWVSKNFCVVPAFSQSSAMLGKLQNSWHDSLHWWITAQERFKTFAGKLILFLRPFELWNWFHVQVFECQGKPLTCASTRLELTWHNVLRWQFSRFRTESSAHGIVPGSLETVCWQRIPQHGTVCIFLQLCCRA